MGMNNRSISWRIWSKPFFPFFIFNFLGVDWLGVHTFYFFSWVAWETKRWEEQNDKREKDGKTSNHFLLFLDVEITSNISFFQRNDTTNMAIMGITCYVEPVSSGGGLFGRLVF